MKIISGIVIVSVLAFPAVVHAASEVPAQCGLGRDMGGASPAAYTSDALPTPAGVEARADILPLPAGSPGDSGFSVSEVEAVTATIVPILLIPQGSSVSSTMQTALTQAIGNVRRWYIRELPNKNPKWEPLQILYGDLTAQEYLTDNRVWSVMPDEIQRKLGWNPWGTGTTRRIALIIGRDLLGWAGGNGYSCEGRGMAILGLESLVDRVKCRGNWWCSEEVWYGTAIHELGHAFSLPHDTDPSSIMSFHGNYTCKRFVPTHAQTVECSPAMDVKYANWALCSTDYVCSSKRCGGNLTGSNLWCLPSDAYSKDAQYIPDHHSCREPYQCASGRCELHPNGYKVCSASALPQYITAPFFPDVLN